MEAESVIEEIYRITLEVMQRYGYPSDEVCAKKSAQSVQTEPERVKVA